MKYLSAVSERCQQVLLLYWWPDSTRGERSQAIIPFTALSNNGFKSWTFFNEFYFGFCANVPSQTHTLGIGKNSQNVWKTIFTSLKKIWSMSVLSACRWPDNMIHKNRYDLKKGTSVWNAKICLIFWKWNCCSNHNGHYIKGHKPLHCKSRDTHTGPRELFSDVIFRAMPLMH